MDIRVLRYFLTVVREENISKAAQALHVTQPTLSRQMAQLEDELGAPLFVRGKRLTLTDAGMLLRRRAEEVTELMDRIEDEFASREEVGAFHTGRPSAGGKEPDHKSGTKRNASDHTQPAVCPE